MPAAVIGIPTIFEVMPMHIEQMLSLKLCLRSPSDVATEKMHSTALRMRNHGIAFADRGSDTSAFYTTQDESTAALNNQLADRNTRPLSSATIFSPRLLEADPALDEATAYLRIPSRSPIAARHHQ